MLLVHYMWLCNITWQVLYDSKKFHFPWNVWNLCVIRPMVVLKDSTCIKFCVVLQFLLNIFVNNVMFWVFCAMTTYSPWGGYQHCGGTCCLHRLGMAVLNFVKLFCFCKICDFYSGVFKNCGHLECDVALLDEWLVIFYRNVSTWPWTL